MPTTLQTAQVLHASGYSVIPTKKDKRPLVSWKEYMTRQPTDKELSDWFGTGASSIALVGGKVQALDFDEKYSAGIFAAYAKRSEEVGLDMVLGSLLRQRTPSGGFHLVWRCEGEPIRNLKLASKKNHECMIETRGDGGYFLISPSPGYTLEIGDWSHIPTISTDDRDALLSLARSFDELPPAEAPQAPQPLGHDVTPGDDYDFRADIPALLRAHGWASAGSSEKYWTRPGKKRGVSASWGVIPDRLWVFSSSTQFEPNHCYRPWHVYAVLECGGDFSRAASELRRQGFGGARKKHSSAPIDAGPAIEEGPPIEGIDPHGDVPTTETEDEKLWRRMQAAEFDETITPPPLVPIYSLAGVVICTPGNLTSVGAQVKVGKSALIIAMMASAMSQDVDRDFLTASGYNAAGKAVLYVDTEQSKDDFWWSVDRAKRRAGLTQRPEWLKAYTLTSFDARSARRALRIAMARLAEQFGGIHSVIIDGIADLVLDVNDAEECNGLVSELHALAIRYECAIICVIHHNPGSVKTRGHLGSQIERKAETNLTLEKEDEVTVVWSAKQRRAPIDKATGPRFRWDDELRMHVTVQSVPRASRKLMELAELAETVLAPGQVLRWSELLAAVQDARATPNRTPSDETARRWINAMREAGIITANNGSYALHPKYRLAS